MKKIITLILTVAMLITTVSCGNTNNPPAGQQARSIGWLVEVGAPTDTLGLAEGQMCLDQDSFDLYQLSGGQWILIGSIRGSSDEAPTLEEKNGVWYINGRNTKLFGTDLARITVIGDYIHVNGIDTGITQVYVSEEPPVDDTPTLEYLTVEEFNSQPAMFGSPWVSNNTRMKILVKVRMSRGTKITFLGDTSVYCWGVMESTDKDNASAGAWKDTGWNTSWSDPYEKTYTTTYATGYFVITVGKLDANGKPNLKLTDEELANIHTMFKVEGVKAEDASGNVSNNGSVNNEATRDKMVSVGHRGWYQAPENTLAAYRESYNHGFKYVECDVQFTKDGVAVLLHDDTIDRTSNGSGYLSQMTYAELLQYDFSYDDNDTVNDFSAYRGEKIPTFVDFIALCKELGLHPYIEIKGTMTDAEAQQLIKIVNDAGMTDKVSWLGFSGDALSKISMYSPTSRLVWVITDTNAQKIEANNVPYAQANLMTGQNQVVFDIWYSLATQDVVDVVSKYGIPLEVWTVNDINVIKKLNPYVTGVSSDYYNAKEVLKNAEIER